RTQMTSSPASGIVVSSDDGYRDPRHPHSFPTRRSSDLAASVGAAGAHGGMTKIDMEWAEATRRLKGDLDMYCEVQTFLPRVGERSEEHTSELQSRENLVCRLLLEKKNKNSHAQEGHKIS